MSINMGPNEIMAFLHSLPEEIAFGFCFSFNEVVAMTKASDFTIYFKERKVEFFNEKKVKLAEMFY